MPNTSIYFVVATLAGCLAASTASAGPVLLSDAQMDSVVAAGANVTFTDGFICPVISTDNVLHSPKGMAISQGDYTIIGPDVVVPLHATNDNGTGSPSGDHLGPGQVGYTAIWAQ